MKPSIADPGPLPSPGPPPNENGQRTRALAIGICCLTIILSLVLGVGLATNLVLRHVMQTLPLWIGVALGFQRSRLAGWFALPSFLCWIFLMALIWAFLLGLSHVISGSFQPIEVLMTVTVGLASLAGIFFFMGIRSVLSPPGATIIFLGMALFQCGCLYVSFLPAFAHR
jgi:hypothetical protein